MVVGNELDEDPITIIGGDPTDLDFTWVLPTQIRDGRRVEPDQAALDLAKRTLKRYCGICSRAVRPELIESIDRSDSPDATLDCLDAVTAQLRKQQADKYARVLRSTILRLLAPPN